MFYTSHKVSISIKFVFGGVQKDFSCKYLFIILLGHLEICRIPLDMLNSFYLEALECFDLWCGYAVYSNLGYVIFEC